MLTETCILCASGNLSYLGNFLSSAPANNLATSKTEALKAQKYPLELAVCDDCLHIQLSYTLPAEILFGSYNYETGISTTFDNHFKNLSYELINRLKHLDKVQLSVLDIGSNDACLLKHFKSLGCQTHGVEPAFNLAHKTSLYHHIVNDFFSLKLSEKLESEHGKFDIITANNVFAHTTHLRDCFRGVAHLLSENGIFSFEVQYALPLLENGLFDMIYHEHSSYHMLTPLVRVLPGLGLKVVDVQEIPTHGGSIRVFCQHLAVDHVSDRVDQLLQKEQAFLSHSLLQAIRDFQLKSLATLDSIATLIIEQSISGHRIIGFTAPAKATTILNNIRPSALQKIECVVDDAPFKKDRFIPGTHLQIISRDTLSSTTPVTCNLLVIFAWNIAVEIVTKLKGTRLADPSSACMIPMPSPRILRFNS